MDDFNDELTDEKDLTLVLDDVEYSVTAEYFYSDKYLYGADADGNRGETRQDLVECQLLNAFDEDGKEVTDKATLAQLTRLAEQQA